MRRPVPITAPPIYVAGVAALMLVLAGPAVTGKVGERARGPEGAASREIPGDAPAILQSRPASAPAARSSDDAAGPSPPALVPDTAGRLTADLLAPGSRPGGADRPVRVRLGVWQI